MYAFCTLVMRGDSYIPGALALAQSLRNVGTKHDIVCMVTLDTADKICLAGAHMDMRKVFTRIIIVNYISKECIPMKSKKQNDMYGEWIDVSFTKWNCISPDIYEDKQYSKVLFLDSDVIVTKNIDDLFELSAPAMTCMIPWARPYVCKNVYGLDLRSTFEDYAGELKHGERVSVASIRRGLHRAFVPMATSVLVSPNKKDFKKIIELLNAADKYGHPGCISGFDEQVLAEMITHNYKWVVHIGPEYNWWIGKTNVLEDGMAAAKVIHYYGADKPWTHRKSEWDDLELWWKIADEVAAYGGLKRYFTAI